jgi:hypothetical protein
VQIKLLGMNVCDSKGEPIMYVRIVSRGERLVLYTIAFVAGIMTGLVLALLRL